MKKIIKHIRTHFTLACLAILFSLTACQDFVDVDPQDKLNSDQVYRDVFDADAAIVGLYGKFMGLAQKYVILNELRADLMTTTENADLTLQELHEHAVSNTNPYANPKDFYELINNCNDILKNFKAMRADNRLDTDDFNERYSDIGTLRSWLYLQLGIHYGSVPYITEPIENINDIKNPNLFTKIPFNQLLDELILFTEALPFKNPYSENSSLVINVDGYNTAKFFINKECLLGDLQLWKGNYTEAASHYKNVMETGSTSGDDSFRFDTYRVKFGDVATNNDLTVGYIRFREQDETALVNNTTQGWNSIFTRSRDVLWNTEWIWSIPFNYNFEPKNPFRDLFYTNYLVKPSDEAIGLWNNETQRNGFPYDARGSKFSYITLNQKPYVKKYLNVVSQGTNSITFNITDVNWLLYRAGLLHLRYAEAANRDNQHKIADAILNFGIGNAYTVAGETDKTNIEQTKQPFPYDFDARFGDFPRYRADWHRNGGVRGRAYVQRAQVVGDSLTSIEDNLIKEAALELAFEGNRWGDLVRIALRRNDPAFLADKIYAKLSKEGNPKANEVRNKLMTPANWYLPFIWKENE